MLSAQILEALDSLTAFVASAPVHRVAIHSYFRVGADAASRLTPEARAAAAVLERELPAALAAARDGAALTAVLGEARGELLLDWAAGSVARADVALAPLLAAAARHASHREVARRIARARVVEGPLEDALRSVPVLGDGDVLRSAEHAEARARLEILIWEAGASGLELPELGPYLWGNASTFDALVWEPARGSLRGRVLAARCLELTVRGMPRTTDPQLMQRTLEVLQPLLFHPEPLVWVHAARALGRLVGAMEDMRFTLVDWASSAAPALRRRAMTGFASMPGDHLRFFGHQLGAIVESPDDEWALSAAAVATPYLYFEWHARWQQLADRIVDGAGGAAAARALARGLATLYRRGLRDDAIVTRMRRLRELARRARPDGLDETRRWLEVISITDPIDGAERDPLDVELGLENLMRLAAQYDDEEADARAARFAESLQSTFEEARRVVLGEGSLRHRAAAMNAFEGCARSLALRLWRPQLATRPQGEATVAPSLGEVWSVVTRAPTELLEPIHLRRESGTSDPELDEMLEVLAVRIGGYALDACGEEREAGPGRGPTAHGICRWLRKIEGLADGSRELPEPLQSALSSLLWRLVDTTRGTALGEVDDVQWLGPFAAWWALVIDRPAMLQQLTTALPLISEGALEKCCSLADTIRTTVASGLEHGAWGASAEHALAELHADDTELGKALIALAAALAAFSEASGTKPKLDACCHDLVLAAERLQSALADPVRALHSGGVPEGEGESAERRSMAENAPRVALLVARAIRARELSLLDVWFASLGPIASSLVETAIRGAVRRTPPPPPRPPKAEPKSIEGYELVKALGEGGVGSVWLVRKPGADRYFVLKIPKADALEAASETERAGILASFVEEAKALAGLYHPNVANIIDRGVSGGMPFLVLEYLIGADLKQYASARRMTLFELRNVVHESCAGLAALHSAGLVHRDIKPANLWLRLPLRGGERFDGTKHRDPARTPPLSSVVIDFGMVRAMKVAPEASGRFVAGTPGYIAPEQVLDPVELDGRADVYSLAGTIYNVTTGRSFFDQEATPRDRIFAHMNREPLEDASLLTSYPAALVSLMRAATAKNPNDRPHPLEFGREFLAHL